jgi:hypothetical protein
MWKCFQTNTSIVLRMKKESSLSQCVKVGDYSLKLKRMGILLNLRPLLSMNKATNLVFELKLSTTNNKPPTAPVLVTPVIMQLIKLYSRTWLGQPLILKKDSLKYEVILRKDSNSDVVVYSDISKSKYNLKGLTYSTKYYWQISVSDGINPPV